MTEQTPRPEEPVDATDATDTEQAATTSDGKILATPLALYGLVAFAMVAVIVITAVKLNDELNVIDEQYASIEPAVALEPVSNTEVRAGDHIASNRSAAEFDQSASATVGNAYPVTATPAAVTAQPAESPAPVEHAVDSPALESALESALEPAAIAAVPVQAAAALEDAVATGKATIAGPAPVTGDTDPAVVATAPVRTTPFMTDAGFERMMREEFEEHLAEMQQYDEERLERYKAMLDERVERMNERITRTQQLIAETRQRNTERYAAREAAVQERQARRAERMNRI